MGENAAAFVFAGFGQEVVDVAVEVRSRFVHDQEGGSAIVLRDNGPLKYGLEHQRDKDAPEMR